jgi:hypothetical protein
VTWTKCHRCELRTLHPTQCAYLLVSADTQVAALLMHCCVGHSGECPLAVARCSHLHGTVDVNCLYVCCLQVQ